MAIKLVKSKFAIGDRVKKIIGWKYFGVVVAVFNTTKGDLRYVVENTGENDGQLFIFNEGQLVPDDNARNFNYTQSYKTLSPEYI